MRIIFDAAAPVKTARRPFGAGILPTAPTYRAPYTSDDAAWWAANAPSAGEPDWDALAAESYATDCVCRGLIPSETAEVLMGSSIIGHPA
jgi:hypothetical protein